MRYFLSFFTLLFIFTNCQKDTSPVTVFPGFGPADWLVPKNEVLDGGVGLDGIPSIDNPQFSTPTEIGPYYDNNLVLGFVNKGVIKSYPIPILDWHEIVNDEVGGLPISITYCPLTGTGIGWSRLVNGIETSFGVSGLLYNSNLMPYDRRTNSTWSQLENKCVNGNFIGRTPQTYTLVETNFSTWQKAFPDTKVMNGNTGFDRAYAFYPYGDYVTNNDLVFYPLNNKDNRLPAKERLLGVLINDAKKTYQFNDIAAGTAIIYDEIDNQQLIIIRSKKENFIIAFFNEKNLKFEAKQDGWPILMTDDKGNAYNLVGQVIDGPDVGTRLAQPHAYMGYWFAWGAFFPDVEIY